MAVYIVLVTQLSKDCSFHDTKLGTEIFFEIHIGSWAREYLRFLNMRRYVDCNTREKVTTGY